jgi:hypothetical protein
MNIRKSVTSRLRHAHWDTDIRNQVHIANPSSHSMRDGRSRRWELFQCADEGRGVESSVSCLARNLRGWH